MRPSPPGLDREFSLFLDSDLQEVVLDRKERCRRARGDSSLRVDVLQVVVDRLGSDAEMGGDLVDRAADRDAPQHIDFAIGQVGRPSAPHGSPRITRGGEYGVHRACVELAVVGIRRSSFAARSGSRAGRCARAWRIAL
jgi:hypothetical protein